MAITTLTYFPVLFNDFSGDDRAIFAENSFYYEHRHLANIFSKAYTTDPLKAELPGYAQKGSGSVAYRPVLSLTYFLDAGLWGRVPFGFHLTNLLIHLINVCLLYILLLSVLNLPIAFGAALIFGVHPLNVEAVANIGYRADLLASMFILASCFFWQAYLRRGGAALFLTLGAYFLALFSKETAILTPLLWCGIARCMPDDIKRNKWPAYFGAVVIFMFYLVTYFIVFPNPAIKQGFFWLGEKPWELFLINGEIVRLYFLGVVWPFGVRMLPGLYYPIWGSFYWLPALFSWGVFVLLSLSMMQGLWLKKWHGFFLLWAFIFWFPASNLLPNPNPMAYRYLYVPLAGASVLIMILLAKLFERAEIKRIAPNIGLLLFSGLIGALCITSFFNTKLWRNNFSIGMALVRYYPDHYKGHEMLASQYASYGMFTEATRHLKLAVKDPRMRVAAVPSRLGGMLLKTGDLKEAFFFLRLALSIDPDYAPAYKLLAFYYEKRGNQQIARFFNQKAARLK